MGGVGGRRVEKTVCPTRGNFLYEWAWSGSLNVVKVPSFQAVNPLVDERYLSTAQL
jgi:hypothetical protein